MLANSLSPCIITAKVEESRDFYVKHFGAKITFDCGWYVNLEFGKGTSLHPWGDRGFAVQDPNCIVLYIYSEREPSPEFKQYYKS